MATVNRILGKVLAYCGYPMEDTLPVGLILDILYGRLDYYRNQLALANQGRLLERWIVQVDSSTDEYAVTASNYGSPILLETYSSTTTNYERRPIRIANIQDANLMYQGIVKPTFIEETTRPTHNAVVVGFWGDASTGVKMRFMPHPSGTAEYMLWYTPSKASEPALNSSPQIDSSYHDMLAVHTALLAIDHCNWFIPGTQTLMPAQERLAHLRNIKESLMGELMRYQQQFEQYRRSNDQEQAGQRRRYDANRRWRMWR